MLRLWLPINNVVHAASHILLNSLCYAFCAQTMTLLLRMYFISILYTNQKPVQSVHCTAMSRYRTDVDTEKFTYNYVPTPDCVCLCHVYG